mmetsp:Transcript_39923/g.78969  ORF Transcript_39923/g.78969 Transcript_39923/m.78969 type:complete len:147 (+) Transcript_39923:53-493(+)
MNAGGCSPPLHSSRSAGVAERRLQKTHFEIGLSVCRCVYSVLVDRYPTNQGRPCLQLQGRSQSSIIQSLTTVHASGLYANPTDASGLGQFIHSKLRNECDADGLNAAVVAAHACCSAGAGILSQWLKHEQEKPASLKTGAARTRLN